MRKMCLDMIHELAKQDPRVVFMGSDLGAGTLESFQKEMPARFFMEGISEANVIGMAAGLALEGKIPYVNTIATFLTRRCLDQVAIDLCLHNANVRLIGNGGGLVYAPLGPTHEAIEDIALLRALPNMTILAPADADEMRRLMRETLHHDGPMYIRLAKGYDPIVTSDALGFTIGEPYLYRYGADALIITTGITLQIALKAAETLHESGIEASVLHAPTIKPLNEPTISEYLSRTPVVVTIEEHSIYGGLGSAIAEIIAEGNFQAAKKFRRIGIPDVFPDQYGSQASLMARYAITAESIHETVTELVEH